MTEKTRPNITMSSPDLTDAEREVIAEVMETPMLSMGPYINKFEAALADYIGVKHAIGVNSGTAGLHLCVRAAGIEPGDMVITTPFSFVASTNVILFEHAIPVFVDVDPRTGNIDPVQVRAAIRGIQKGGAVAQNWLPRKGAEYLGDIKAILPVDVFGQPADMDPLNEIAEEYGLKIIEDSCEAIGAKYKNRPAGKLGDYGVFAFYPNKQMTTGEGGVIVTDDDKAAHMMRALRNQGRAPGDTWLQHTHMGYNYRMDEMSAALGYVQLKRLDVMLAKRAQVAKWYQERLSRIARVEVLDIMPETTQMSWFVFVVRLAKTIDRDKAAEALRERGIPARPYFIPIHLQPYMVDKFGYQPGDFPVTEDLGNRGLALPFSGVMPEHHVDWVCNALREVLWISK